MKRTIGSKKYIAIILALSMFTANITTVYGNNVEELDDNIISITDENIDIDEDLLDNDIVESISEETSETDISVIIDNTENNEQSTEEIVDDSDISESNDNNEDAGNLDEENQDVIDEETMYVPGEIVVCLNGNYTQEDLEWLFSNNLRRSVNSGISVAEVKDLTKAQKPVYLRSAVNQTNKQKIFMLKLSDEQQDIFEVIEMLNDYPEIEYASPNYVFKAEAPTASYYDYEDEDEVLNMWGLEYVKGPEAWEYCSGSPDVVIGIVDSGVDFNHPDLAGNMWINQGEWGVNGELANNGIDDDGNGYIDDVNGWNFYYDNNETYDVDGHGTHVAGTAAADGNNNQGVYGVAKDCSIASLRISSDPEDGPWGYAEYDFAAVIEALDYANAMDIPVTNNSYSEGLNFLPDRDEAFSAIFEAAIGNYDGLFVASAGNDGEGYDANYPAAYDCDNIISVSGSNRYGDPEYDYFNFDADTVDLAAPGMNIWSCKYNTNTYVSYRGTSMAVPHVVGAVALLKSFKPQMTSAQIKDCIMTTVTKTPGMAGDYFAASEGILNVEAALIKAEELFPEPETSIGKLKTWNFSTYAFSTLGAVTASTTISGLTLNPAGNTMEVKSGNTLINNRDEYTNYLLLGGNVEFDVTGDTDIYITAKSNAGTQTLTVTDEDGNTVTGGSLSYTTNAGVQVVRYTGEPQTIALSGNNIRLVNITKRTLPTQVPDWTDSNWSFSDSKFANIGIVSSKITVDGLLLYPDVQLIDRTENINGTAYTRYLDLKGKGSKEYREVSFFVTGDTQITVSAMSPTEERTLQIIDGFGCVIGEMTANNTLKTETFNYEGNPADIYIRSTRGGIRLYDIKAEQVLEEVDEDLSA